jgi:hypothetical protein
LRAVVLDSENRVFLVKHSYVSGWHLPGGGVETGETFDLTRRELLRRRIEMTGEPVLHGPVLQPPGVAEDHVAVYVVRGYRQAGMPEPNREIVYGFSCCECRPTPPGTRARIAEVLGSQPPAED